LQDVQPDDLLLNNQAAGLTGFQVQAQTPSLQLLVARVGSLFDFALAV
jgi:hypothetical protein